MNFIKWAKLSLLSCLALAACNTTVDQTMISQAPIPSGQIAYARKAVEICGSHVPNMQNAQDALLANGYRETTDERLANIRRTQRVTILENDNSNVIVLLGSQGRRNICVVGLEGLTPQQSYSLALPWVKKFDAQTNAERGQGLSNNASQAWGVIEEERIVNIVAYKTWDILDAPGAAVRLIHIKR